MIIVLRMFDETVVLCWDTGFWSDKPAHPPFPVPSALGILVS